MASREQEESEEEKSGSSKKPGIKQLNVRISGKTLEQYHDIMAYYHREREDVSTVELVSRGINAIWHGLMSGKTQAAAREEIKARGETEQGAARIWQFFAEFEPKMEELDAKRFEAFAASARAPTPKVYEDALTAKLLLRLKTMQYTPDIDPATHHWVSAWVQAVEQELFNLDLEAKRTALRQTVDNTWFQIQGKSYTADSLLQVLLPEEQDRQLRVEAGNHLVHLAQQIEPQMREAMLKANTLWQQCGFVNAIPPKLRTIGVSETLVRQVIVTLEKMTRDIAQSTLNEYEDLLGHEVTPWEWHYAVKTLMQPFEESLKEENVVQGVQRTFRGIGLDLEQLPIQFIEAPASAGVQVFPVRIPSDIRIRHGMQQGYRGYRRWLKALGEACYYAHIDAKQAYAFRRYAPGVLADGLATLSSWVLWEPAWLEEFTHMSSEQISICSEQMKRYELLKWRYDAGLALFEMDAYRVLAEDPEANLDQLYGKHLEKFLRVPFEELPVWALDQRLIEPFPYFSSKALGVAIAANLAETLYKGSESLYSPKFGKIFQSALVHQGGSKLWTESLQQLTSKPITTVAMPM